MEKPPSTMIDGPYSVPRLFCLA